MKILVLTADPGGPSFRFRVAQFLPLFRERGWQVDVRHLDGGVASRLRALRSAAECDTVWLHRALLPATEWLVLSRSAHRYVFEFDDAVLYRDSPERGFESRQRRARFRRTVGGARAVVAGNRYLADLASPHADNVTVIPTVVAPAPTVPARPSADDSIATIGWIGSRSNLRYLRELLSAIATVRVPSKRVRLLVVCDAELDASAEGVEIENKRWSLADEASDIGRFDVGIMPLPDDPWTRGKCGAKILQYLDAGVPVVCSPVGVNRDIVRHGRSGYLATSPDEWREALEDLLGDVDRRAAFAAEGRRTVDDSFRVEHGLSAWGKVFERL